MKLPSLGKSGDLPQMNGGLTRPLGLSYPGKGQGVNCPPLNNRPEKGGKLTSSLAVLCTNSTTSVVNCVQKSGCT